MDVKYLSTTLIGGWQQCPARSWRSAERRAEHGDDNEGTNPTRFGTVVHNTCEQIHQLLMQGAEVDEDLMVQIFDEQWRANTCTDFEYFSYGRDRIASFIHRSVYDREGETIAVELLFVMDLGTREVWVNPDDPKTIINMIRERGGVPAMSKIDRVDRAGNKFVVYDYKTNMLPFTRYYIETSQQLGLYDLAIRAIFPEAEEVECVYDMLRHGRFPVQFDDLFRDNLRAFLINLWFQIRDTDKPEERLNEYCRWCERRAECGVYAAALESIIPPVLTDVTDCDDGYVMLHAELETLNAQAKLIDQRKDEIKAMFTAKIIQDNDGKPLVISGGKEIYLAQNKRREINVPAMFDSLKANNALVLLKHNMSLSLSAAERMAKQHPALRDAIDEATTERHLTPSIKVRKAGSKSNEDSGTTA